MAIGNIPSVFVSSTCYDLLQVRADIRSFIESLGFNPILSNYNSFPTDPDVNPVENCFKVVDESADIFVLIVGSRYGSTPSGDKSVTNLEYLRARAKGIPVYAFVQKSILNILPVWRANQQGNFQDIVDSPKLFEFVSSLLDSSGVWVFPFEFAQEITDTLRKQLAYLFMDALHLRMRAKAAGLTEPLSQLQGTPLRLVIERPLYWEYRLFAHVLAQEISRAKRLRQDLTYGIAFGRGEHYDNFEVLSWIARKASAAERIVTSSGQILNVALLDALGPPGVEADPEAIVYVAQKLAESYRSAIEWAIEFQRISVDDDFRRLVKIAARLIDNVIREIEEWSGKIHMEIEAAIASLPLPPGEQRVMEFTLTLTVPDMAEFHQELQRLKHLYGVE
jgi:hypothetical protein